MNKAIEKYKICSSVYLYILGDVIKCDTYKTIIRLTICKIVFLQKLYKSGLENKKSCILSSKT